MKYFLLISLFISVFGCSRPDHIPKDIIQPDNMRKIMWDLLRADAYAANYIMPDSTRDWKAESAVLYEKVFVLHSTTREEFKKSMVFYESRPDLLKIITDSLRADEKRVQTYPDPKRMQQPDTNLRKIKPSKKLIPK